MIQAVKDNPADPVAVIIGSLGLMASSLGLWAKLGLTSDQVGGLIAGLITIAGAVRALVVAHRAKEAAA